MTITEDTRKHLDYIQAIINRHNTNSFILKGWAITLTIAIVAFSGSVKQPYLIFASIPAIFLFWALDALYLSNERCFVDLYNTVAEGSSEIPKAKCFKAKVYPASVQFESYTAPLYSMSFKVFKMWRNNMWFYVLGAWTILGLYLSLLILVAFTGIAYLYFKECILIYASSLTICN